VLAKWYKIHSLAQWTDSEVDAVRHLTVHQLDELEELEKKHGATVNMKMCDIDGLRRQAFGSVAYRMHVELRHGRLKTIVRHLRPRCRHKGSMGSRINCKVCKRPL
jgi:hypothetical protein